MTGLSKLIFSLEKDYFTVCWGLSKYRVSISSIANVIFHVHKIYFSFLNNCSITLLKSMNRGSEMTRVFRGLTNGYNIHNAFRQRSTKVFIDSGGKLLSILIDNSKIRLTS